MSKTLVTYGAYNMSTAKCLVSTDEGFSAYKVAISRLVNTRLGGSSVVNVREDEKPIVLTGKFKATDHLTVKQVYDEFARYSHNTQRLLREARVWIEIAKLADSSNYNPLGDAINKQTNYTNWQYENSSVSVDADVSLSGSNFVGLERTDLDTVNLSDYIGLGNFEAWVYIPDPDFVSSITLVVGSDNANYISGTVSSQLDDEPLKAGWNLVSIPWSEMIATGAIDPWGIEYMKILLNYTSDQQDMNGILFGGLIWVYDDATAGYMSYVDGLTPDGSPYNVTKMPFNASFICPDGFGTQTTNIQALAWAGITSTTNSQDVVLDGSYDPAPVITMKLKAITNLSKIQLSNNKGGGTVTVSPVSAWAINDTIVIDSRDRTVKINGVSVAYDSVIPLWFLGENTLLVGLVSTSQNTQSQLLQDINLTGEI